MGNVSVGINKQFGWLSKKNGDIFEEPIRVRFNTRPSNSEAIITASGLEFPDYIRITGTERELEIFNFEDKYYFRKIPPKIHDKLQTSPTSANYEVVRNPQILLTTGEILLRRIANR